MRVTIHIGTYTTATSAIQHSLERNTEQLAAAGVRYARAGRGDRLGRHLHLFDHVIDSPHNHERHRQHAGAAYLDQLRAELDEPGVEHLVISEEELSCPDAALPAFFAPLGELADVRVVMAVRQQAAFLESLYSQFMSARLRRLTCSFEEFCADEDFAARGDFAAILDMWADVFGRDSIITTDFDQLRTNRDVVSAYGRLMELPTDLPSPGRHVDPTMSPAAAELLRKLGVVRADFPRQQLVPTLRALDSSSGSLLTSRIRESIAARYEASNAALREGFGVDLQPAVGPADASDGNDATSDALDLAAAVIEGLWKPGRRPVPARS